MKASIALKCTLSVITSQTLLWRIYLQGPLFILWGFLCCKVSTDSIMRMDANTMMIWLWGVNIWVFLHSNVNYGKVFELDHTHLTHREIWKCASWMTIIVPTSMTSYLYLYSHGEVVLAALQPVFLYTILVLILVIPFDIFYMSSRIYFLQTLWRLTFPLQGITFADFFLADVLTSMAKVLSDLERSVCRMVKRQVATIAWLEADAVCGSHSLSIPCVLAFPYVSRFFQCLRQYVDTREKSCLLNALKYATVFPVIILSALKYHVPVEMWTRVYRPLWLLSSVINSCYSFYWDITRDWGFSVLTGNFKSKNPLLRPNLIYSRRWVYYWAIVSNLLLRCAWTYKLSSHLRHNYLTGFVMTALEIIRRFQWSFFRVENEWIKISPMPNFGAALKETTSEKAPLLGSIDRGV